MMSQTITWEDGLAAAIRELIHRGHEVKLFMPDTTDYVIRHPYFDIEVKADVKSAVAEFNPAAILIWGDFTRPNIRPLRTLHKPLAICFAGGEVNHVNKSLFDHIFVESEVYRKKFEDDGLPVSIAFGTNTDLFKPVEQVKTFDTIFPATFALWKRHDLYAKATAGLRSLAVGYIYDDHEQECWQTCLDNGVTILPHTSAQVLHYLYAASRICVVPSRSDGGSQRTVLEAMAMNLPLIITDSDKYDYCYGRVFQTEPKIESIKGHINAILDGGFEADTRDYVLENWSHISYADVLETGLLALL